MADDEIVALVDGHNRVIGSATRRRMRAERLVHRATYVFVFNSQGELFVQKRTPTKDMYPGYHDVAAGGVVIRGESYEESARREAREELGITDPLAPLFDFYYEDEWNRIWGRAFRCVHDGEFVLQPEEVESGRFMSIEEILSGAADPVTPDTMHALERYLEQRRERGS